MPSAICSNLEKSKILSSGNGLKHIKRIQALDDPFVYQGMKNIPDGDYQTLIELLILASSILRDTGTLITTITK